MSTAAWLGLISSPPQRPITSTPRRKSGTGATQMPKVYLGGPIADRTDDECVAWRLTMLLIFPNAIDPIRRDYRGRESECYREVVELDKRDILAADVLLVKYDGRPSVGTSMEILFAWEHHIPIVLVAPMTAKLSPWLLYHCTKIVSSLDAAADWIKKEIGEEHEGSASCHRS